MSVSTLPPRELPLAYRQVQEFPRRKTSFLWSLIVLTGFVVVVLKVVERIST